MALFSAASGRAGSSGQSSSHEINERLPVCISGWFTKIRYPRCVVFFPPGRDFEMPNKPKAKSDRKRRAGHLGRAEVELELMRAAAQKRVPSLSGKHMIATNLSSLDFTSEYLMEGGPFTADLLHGDFRNAKLRRCNFAKADLALTNLRGTDLPGGESRGCQPIFGSLTACRLEERGPERSKLSIGRSCHRAGESDHTMTCINYREKESPTSQGIEMRRGIVQLVRIGLRALPHGVEDQKTSVMWNTYDFIPPG